MTLDEIEALAIKGQRGPYPGTNIVFDARILDKLCAIVRAADAMRAPQTIDNLIKHSEAKLAAYDKARAALGNER